MEAGLTPEHGKVARHGSKDPTKEFAETLNKLTSHVHEAKDHGSPADTELIYALANLDLNSGQTADEAIKRAATVWVTLQDQEDVVEAVRLDAVGEMTEQLNDTWVEEGASLITRRRKEMERARGVGALRRHPMLNHFSSTSALWRGQRRGPAIWRPPSTCKRSNWRGSKPMHLRPCGTRTLDNLCRRREGEGEASKAVALHKAELSFFVGLCCLLSCLFGVREVNRFVVPRRTAVSACDNGSRP